MYGRQLLLTTVVLLTPTIGSGAAPTAEEWQLNRLFHPTTQQLQREGDGRIFIYDGLSDRVVQQALNREFDRVGAMMFVNVKKTDERGEVMTDPASGEALVEDDGC